MGDKYTVVQKIPDCDLCARSHVRTPAYADAKLDAGPWAFVCRHHFNEHKCSLGLGRGQKLVLR